MKNKPEKGTKTLNVSPEVWAEISKAAVDHGLQKGEMTEFVWAEYKKAHRTNANI